MTEQRILIVDDDADLSAIISDMLTDHGFEVACVESAAEAFAILEKRSFELLILDINLPDESGFALCRELRAASSVPVIFASARTDEMDRITGFDLGGDDYIPKPYSMKELLSRVNALLRRSYGMRKEDLTVRFGDVCVQLGI